MSDIISEEEQVEAIKKWFKENGTSWLVAICFVLLVIAGHNYYQRLQAQKLQVVAANYEKVSADWLQVMNAIYSGQDDARVRIKAQILQSAEGLAEDEALVKARTLVRAEVTSAAQELMKNHPKTAYAQFTAMSLASMSVAENKIDEAEQHLQWALDHVRDKALEPLVRLRLARIQISLKKFDSAQTLLSTKRPVAFDALYEDTLGDLFNVQGNREKAVSHYRQALQNLDSESPLSAQLKVKLNDLGEKV